jgi:hypothetical protein
VYEKHKEWYDEHDMEVYVKKSRKQVDSFKFNNTLIANPIISLRDERKSPSVDLLHTQHYKEVVDGLAMSLKLKKMNSTNMALAPLESNQVDDYILTTIANDYLLEYAYLRDEDMDIIPLSSAYLRTVQTATGMDNMLFMGAQTARVRRGAAGWVVSCFIPVLLPIVIVQSFVPKYTSNYGWWMVDLHTGRMIYAAERSSNKYLSKVAAQQWSQSLITEAKKRELYYQKREEYAK